MSRYSVSCKHKICSLRCKGLNFLLPKILILSGLYSTYFQVKDIQKLAAEMGLNCITAYKLDALKAVRRSNGCEEMTNLDCIKDNIDVTTQKANIMMSQELESVPIVPAGVIPDTASKNGGR